MIIADVAAFRRSWQADRERQSPGSRRRSSAGPYDGSTRTSAADARFRQRQHQEVEVDAPRGRDAGPGEGGSGASAIVSWNRAHVPLPCGEVGRICFPPAIVSPTSRAPAATYRARARLSRNRLGTLLVVLAAAVASAALPDAAVPARSVTTRPLLRPASVGAHGKAHRLFPRFAGAVPVLVYHRLVTADEGPGVAPAVFEAQLRRLHDLGFEAITLNQYVRFIRGDAVELPERPVLITFDDGFASALASADAVLA